MTNPNPNPVFKLIKPKSFTSNEEMIDLLRDLLFASGRTWKDLAEAANINKNTVQRLASGQTKWPKPTTLFPLMKAIGYGLKMEKL